MDEPPAVEEAEPEEDDMLAADEEDDPFHGNQEVEVSIDDIPVEGGLLSGRVKWTDGESAFWAINEMGALDLKMDDPTYQPIKEDIEAFQTKLRALIDDQMEG